MNKTNKGSIKTSLIGFILHRVSGMIWAPCWCCPFGSAQARYRNGASELEACNCLIFLSLSGYRYHKFPDSPLGSLQTILRSIYHQGPEYCGIFLESYRVFQVLGLYPLQPGFAKENDAHQPAPYPCCRQKSRIVPIPR